MSVVMVSMAVLIHTFSSRILAPKRNINPILDVTPQKEITWGCIWRTRWQVVKTLTIISNNPVLKGRQVGKVKIFSTGLKSQCQIDT